MSAAPVIRLKQPKWHVVEREFFVVHDGRDIDWIIAASTTDSFGQVYENVQELHALGTILEITTNRRDAIAAALSKSEDDIPGTAVVDVHTVKRLIDRLTDNLAAYGNPRSVMAKHMLWV